MFLTGRKGLRSARNSVKYSVARKARAIAKLQKRKTLKEKHRIARTINGQRPRGI